MKLVCLARVEEGDEAGSGCNGPGGQKQGNSRGNGESASDSGDVLQVEPRLHWVIGTGASGGMRCPKDDTKVSVFSAVTYWGGKTEVLVLCYVSFVWGQEFSFIYIRFELPLMSPRGDVDEAAGSKDLDSGVIPIEMVPKAT